MRVFLDTNVLVSALAARGLCAELFQALVAGHTVVISPDVLKELEVVLVSKLRFPQRLLNETLAFLLDTCEVADAQPPLALHGLNRADRKIVTAAVAARVDAFVTGDQAILDIRAAEDVPILSPRQLWETLRRK